jgi:predicted nucleotidyltransferase
MKNAIPEMQARILAEIERVEQDHAVEIVLVVESGSRAWGFPSLDSDYDVRFLYIRSHHQST